MSDIMHIGISALAAYQAALTQSSQNIANADTPFYSRRQVDFVESPFNSGVSIGDVRRVFDDTANVYVQTSNSSFSNWNVYLTQLSNFEPLFDDDTNSVGTFINNSLAALREIQSSFSPSNRSLYMDSLTSLAQQFQNVNSEINQELQNVNSTLQTEVGQVNNLINAISSVNDQIASVNGATQPELLDQREALLQQLSTYIDFNRIEESNNTIDIALSNGLSLLTSNPPLNFTTITDPANANNLIIGVQSGSQTFNVTNLIQNGEIAGWINYRQNGLISAQIGLGRLALVMSQSINAQNKLGVDANGNLGVNIFADINSASMQSQRVIANANNTGTSNMSVMVNNVNQILPNDYQLSFGGGNTYVLTRLSQNGNTIVSSGTLSALPTTIDADGFTLNIPAGSTFNNGDLYSISPTRNASSNMTLAITDPSQLALGWPVVTSTGIKNPGSDGAISVTKIVDTTNSAFSTPHQLNPPIKVQFSVSGGVTTYSLYDASTNALIEGPLNYTTGANIFSGTYNPGYQVAITGNNIQDGDTFNIQYNSNVTSDNRNAVAMANLYEAGTVQGANNLLVNFRAGYDLVSSDVSVKTNNAQSQYNTSYEVYNQATIRRNLISGVDLTEETMNLAQYETNYQASAQVLQTAKTIFDAIISLSRGL